MNGYVGALCSLGAMIATSFLCMIGAALFENDLGIRITCASMAVAGGAYLIVLLLGVSKEKV